MDMNKIDRSAFSIGSLHDGGDEKEYWKFKSPQERIQAIEIMRKIIYGHNASTKRLARFLEIAEFEKDCIFIDLENLKNKKASGRLKYLADLENLPSCCSVIIKIKS